MQRPVPALLLVAFVTACGDASLLGPPRPDVSPPALGGAGGPPHAVTVLNWNVYIGADVDRVIGALASPDPTDDFPALLEAIATLQATDFPARAEAIVDDISRARPHVVALQEVWTIQIDLTGAGLPIVIDLDFQAILQDALAARGLDYAVGAIVTNTDATPALPPGLVVRVTDHDAVLVDPSRVTVVSSLAQSFSNNVGPVAPGVALVRGFAAVDATIDGRTFTFVSTHLEPDLGGMDLTALRQAQAFELVTVIGSAFPAVLMGDFNDVPGSPMHQVVTGAGYSDVWAALRPAVDGLTCCHVADLSNKLPTLDERIDYVFARGLGHPIAGVKGRIERLGEVPADRLAGPAGKIWPSDHAGLVGDLLSPPAAGLALATAP